MESGRQVKCEHHDLLGREVLAAVGELAAAVAHEVKNPLAGISGAMQILRDAIPAQDPRGQIIDDVARQVARIDRLIHDLLAFARPWAPQPGEHDLAAMARSVVESLARDIRAKRLSVDVVAERPCPAWVDSALVTTALSNVILNAVEAAPPNGHVLVTCAPLSGGRVRVEVDDDGPGIPPEQAKQLFKPFFTTKPRGTGLGLCIVKRVLDAHDACIEVLPRSGGGTRVRLDFWQKGDLHG